MMKGWKTWIAAVGSIGLGIYQITQGDIVEGVKLIILGLGTIGIGHKIEKAGNGNSSLIK